MAKRRTEKNDGQLSLGSQLDHLQGDLGTATAAAPRQQRLQQATAAVDAKLASLGPAAPVQVTVQRRLKWRVSSLPMNLNCNGSADRTGVLIESDNDEARIGTAVHYVMAAHVQGEYLDALTAARKAGIEEHAETVAQLADYGREAWAELAPAFPNPTTEQHLQLQIGDVDLSGHCDVYSVLADEVRVVDFKSGRKQRDYRKQVIGYALQVCRHTGHRQAKVTVIWLRDRWAETYLVTAEDLDQLQAEIEQAGRRVISGEYTYRVGEHCTYCPRFAACEARGLMLRQVVRDLADPGFAERSLREYGGLAMAYAAVRSIERACEGFRNRLREDLVDGGPITCGGGEAGPAVTYSLKSVNQRELDVAKAWPIVTGNLTVAQLAEITKLPITRVLDVAAKNAPKGQGASVKRALTAMLDEAGAIRTVPQLRINEEKAALPAPAEQPPAAE